MIKDYETFHQNLASKLNITPEDVKFFRSVYYLDCNSKELIAQKIQDRLPSLKENKSRRYEPYLKRLAYLSKVNDKDFSFLMIKYNEADDSLKLNNKRS